MPESCIADVLARKPSADNVDRFCLWRLPCSDVVMLFDIWPAFGQIDSALIVNFHLPFADHSSPLEPKVKSANPREE
jgi:hypothetical protein